MQFTAELKDSQSLGEKFGAREAPAVECRFIYVAKAPLLLFLVATTLAYKYCFLLEISLKTSARVEMNDVFESTVILPKLIALHSMTPEEENRRVSSLGNIPA
jgi:hypothetical protein